MTGTGGVSSIGGEDQGGYSARQHHSHCRHQTLPLFVSVLPQNMSVACRVGGEQGKPRVPLVRSGREPHTPGETRHMLRVGGKPRKPQVPHCEERPRAAHYMKACSPMSSARPCSQRIPRHLVQSTRNATGTSARICTSWSRCQVARIPEVSLCNDPLAKHQEAKGVLRVGGEPRNPRGDHTTGKEIGYLSVLRCSCASRGSMRCICTCRTPVMYEVLHVTPAHVVSTLRPEHPYRCALGGPLGGHPVVVGSRRQRWLGPALHVDCRSGLVVLKRVQVWGVRLLVRATSLDTSCPWCQRVFRVGQICTNFKCTVCSSLIGRVPLIWT